LLCLADQAAHQSTDVESDCRSAHFVPERLTELALAAARWRQEQDAPWTGQRAAIAVWPERPKAKRLERIQPTQIGKSLASPVELQQAAFLERLGLELPDRLRRQTAVPNDRQAEGAFGFIAGQARGRIKQRLQTGSFRQFAGILGDPDRDLIELRPVGEFVLQTNEEFLELDGDLHDRGQNNNECPVLLASRDLPGQRLHNLRRVEKAVKIDEDQKGGPLRLAESTQRVDGRQRVLTGLLGLLSADRESPVDVPGGQAPILGAA